MKTFIVELNDTPFAKIKDFDFSGIKHSSLFNKINTFVEDFKEFKNQNIDSKILINNNKKEPSFPLDFSFDTEKSYLKINNICFEDNKEYSTIIIKNNGGFGSLMKDKSNNNIYLIKSENSESFELSLFEEKSIHTSFKATFSNDNKTHTLLKMELSPTGVGPRRKISNTISFDVDSLAESISGTIENDIKSFYIRFNNNKCQIKDISIVDGKIDTINKASYVYYEMPDHLKNKLASRNKCSLEEMYEITEHLKPKQEFNRLINDNSGFEFWEMDVLLEKIQNIIEENKDRIYFTSNDLVKNFKQIISEALTSEKIDVNILKYKSISFHDYSQFNNNEVSHPSINLKNIKNIFKSLKKDFDTIQKLNSHTYMMKVKY